MRNTQPNPETQEAQQGEPSEIARIIARSMAGCEPGPRWLLLDVIERALAALAESGFVVVPREPTEEMLAAVTAPAGVDDQQWREHARNDWLVMVGAAPR